MFASRVLWKLWLSLCVFIQFWNLCFLMSLFCKFWNLGLSVKLTLEFLTFWMLEEGSMLMHWYSGRRVKLVFFEIYAPGFWDEESRLLFSLTGRGMHALVSIFGTTAELFKSICCWFLWWKWWKKPALVLNKKTNATCFCIDIVDEGGGFLKTYAVDFWDERSLSLFWRTGRRTPALVLILKKKGNHSKTICYWLLGWQEPAPVLRHVEKKTCSCSDYRDEGSMRDGHLPCEVNYSTTTIFSICFWNSILSKKTIHVSLVSSFSSIPTSLCTFHKKRKPLNSNDFQN